MWPNPQETADLVTFPEEFLNGKLHFSVQWKSLKVSESQRSVKTSLAFTAENIVISPDFMVWKFRGKAQFPQSFERFEKKANKINNVNDILSKHVILIYFYDCYHRFFFFDFIFDINRSFLSLHYVVICQLQPVVKINGGNFNYRIITWE